ncbi:methionine gamma-lyase [Algicola sagamiensis]|uniref:methionine gamma-lyase n=1 Tax=Algicola sagamiensis TaxID=163869 RepID=UPI0003646F53|nr:methionine gamma-lyase [Algicola sagamiensis]
MSNAYKPETLCIHAGREHAHPHGALTTPLYQTSTFVFENAAQGARRFAGEEEGYIYTRLGNPTTAELENRVAALEGMQAAAATATGMGAVSASIMAFVAAGDHIIASKAVYGCTFVFLSHLLEKFGVEVSFVDMTDHEAIQTARKPHTKLIFLETPVNPNLVVIDLEFVGRFAKQHQLVSVVDNTFLTPLYQKPAAFGIDLVIHSATKYLNGHGDVVAGIVVGDTERISHIKMTTLKDMGATISPHDAWLILRGLKTLALRMERHSDNAQCVAEYLQKHPKVKRVDYPGLKSHPGYRFIGQQMKRAGGVLSFEINGGVSHGEAFINATELWTLAVSLGDAESLIQHPASMTHSTYTSEERKLAGISDGLIRLSTGLEHVEDLILDLEKALKKI